MVVLQWVNAIGGFRSYGRPRGGATLEGFVVGRSGGGAGLVGLAGGRYGVGAVGRSGGGAHPKPRKQRFPTRWVFGLSPPPGTGTGEATGWGVSADGRSGAGACDTE